MTRTVPIEAGKRYHVYNRGAFRQTIFRDDEDYLRFLNLTRKYLRGPVRLLAYAVLANHFHLYVEVDEEAQLEEFYRTKPAAISKTIGHMSTAYAKYFRYKYKSQGQGAVFQGRFKRRVVSDIGYARNLIHYIHRNPANHGFASEPEDYPFTSLQEALNPQLESYGDREKIFTTFGGEHAFHRSWKRTRLLGSATDKWEDE